ncbi:unnamed protein product [Pleuronectes platessa]|uniref:Uncharacterized protein n=1 Tax=Pleuronectes platessa TaxID=8262 RepID=A0A9N7TYI9_PLEPL|nr:unnamed protein product [Pleuronectes platessa]
MAEPSAGPGLPPTQQPANAFQSTVAFSIGGRHTGIRGRDRHTQLPHDTCYSSAGSYASTISGAVEGLAWSERSSTGQTLTLGQMDNGLQALSPPDHTLLLPALMMVVPLTSAFALPLSSPSSSPSCS